MSLPFRRCSICRKEYSPRKAEQKTCCREYSKERKRRMQSTYYKKQRRKNWRWRCCLFCGKNLKRLGKQIICGKLECKKRLKIREKEIRDANGNRTEGRGR